MVRFDVKKEKIAITKVEIEGFSMISSKLFEEVMVKAEPTLGRPDAH